MRICSSGYTATTEPTRPSATSLTADCVPTSQTSKSYRVLGEKAARKAKAEGKDVRRVEITRWTGQPPGSAAVDADSGERPRWLEPYGGDAEWRQQMWGAIVALHGRYPHHLSTRSKTNGGLTNQPSRPWARSPSGEQSSTKHAKTPATSSPSKLSSTTTPSSYAKKGAGSPRHGSLGHRRQSGLACNDTRRLSETGTRASA
jgi:hypothetical protein